MMAIGLTLKEAVAEMISHPAHEIKRDDLGTLSESSVADIAVLRVEKGRCGFTDMQNTRVNGTEKLVAELTIKDGKIVYDVNGMEAATLERASIQVQRMPHVGHPSRLVPGYARHQPRGVRATLDEVRSQSRKLASVRLTSNELTQALLKE
jgi:hypothetical protein